jgi:gamma-glutamyl-gamma-aminobutyrate hydrolase PuuD
MKKVFITAGAFDNDVVDMFRERGFELVNMPEDCDILCLTGGADIDPKHYGETPINETYASPRRDDYELDCISRAPNAFKFGICRGGQLLNVFNGGKLWQHIEGHDYHHPMTDVRTGASIITSSIHHQMFRITPEAVVIATCNEAVFKKAEHDIWQAGDTPDADVEVCYYPKSRSLCIQGHPEVGPDSFTDYCFDLLTEFYNYAA